MRRNPDEEEAEEYEEVDDEGVDDEADETEEEEEEEHAAETPSTPWTGFNNLPERDDVLPLLEELKASGKRQLTVLLLGKSCVGKSSLVNSFLGEALARVMAFKLQADTEVSIPFNKHVEDASSSADGFKLSLIDTCGLEDPEAGDTVNAAALAKIAADIKGQPIDVVLYVDRLDLCRVEPLDCAILRAIGNTLGKVCCLPSALTLLHAMSMSCEVRACRARCR